eukprot:354991_1
MKVECPNDMVEPAETVYPVENFLNDDTIQHNSQGHIKVFEICLDSNRNNGQLKNTKSSKRKHHEYDEERREDFSVGSIDVGTEQHKSKRNKSKNAVLENWPDQSHSSSKNIEGGLNENGIERQFMEQDFEQFKEENNDLEVKTEEEDNLFKKSKG